MRDLEASQAAATRGCAWRFTGLSLLIAIVVFAGVAPTLSWLEFSSGSENLIVETVLEMRHGGPWLVPNLNGAPRTAKPPMPLAEARAVTRKLVIASDEELIDPQESTVLRRKLAASPAAAPDPQQGDPIVTLNRGERPPNVVLVIMESFSARFVGACGSKPDYTPAFDSLAADGVLFDHAFSGGTHTHQGVFCSMLGFPNLPGFEYLMENIVANQKFLTLPTVLKQRGYQTMFLYNGNLAWDNMEGFFRKQGIDRFIGSPDYVNPIKRDRVWGVTDQDVFTRAADEFDSAAANGPFFSLILTLSNHAPFDLPEPLPFEPTKDMGELNTRLDGVRYADWCVGQFMQAAKTKPWYQNTLFVFVGDHGFHVAPKLTEAHLLYHHVPLLFYSPLLSKKGVVISSAAAQMNILPTVLGLLDVRDQPQASWGRDLFAPPAMPGDENFVVFKGSGGSGSDQAVVMIRGDKLLCAGSTGGTPQLFRYTLNPDPAIEPLTDSASLATRDQMNWQMNAYVESAMSDLTNSHGGVASPGTPMLANQKIAPGTELLHNASAGTRPAADLPQQ